ncbi:aminotransferase class V-fold PLP-dependent enzyme [Escherichia coli]|nr:aminotransferase class V-fold PLP-dependent enzyme [Escherichia coli]
MPAFEWVHVQLHQQKGMISLSPPTICNSAPLMAYYNVPAMCRASLAMYNTHEEVDRLVTGLQRIHRLLG